MLTNRLIRMLQPCCSKSIAVLNLHRYSNGDESSIAVKEGVDWAASTYVRTPKNDDELPLTARFTPITKEMLGTKDIAIKAISNNGFRLIDGTFLHGPVALFPTVALSWRVPSPDHINDDSLHLFSLFEPKLDIVILGVGDLANIDSVRRRCLPFFRKHKIPVEIMASQDAVPLFNYLNEEQRYVAAALFPPINLTVSKRKHFEAMSAMQDFMTTLPGDARPLNFIDSILGRDQQPLVLDAPDGSKIIQPLIDEEKRTIGLAARGINWSKEARLQKERREKILEEKKKLDDKKQITDNK